VASDSEPRNFFWGPPRPPEVAFRAAKASASMLWMICCNHGLLGDFMEAFYRPACTLSNQTFRGGHHVFQRARPPRAPRNSTTGHKHPNFDRWAILPLTKKRLIVILYKMYCYNIIKNAELSLAESGSCDRHIPSPTFTNNIPVCVLPKNLYFINIANIIWLPCFDS